MFCVREVIPLTVFVELGFWFLRVGDELFVTFGKLRSVAEIGFLSLSAGL